MPMALLTSWLAALSCHRFCTRINATSTRARAQRSRGAFHAVSSPFVCYGDNGRRQPNYSTLGGDLATAAIANAYYPASNRGVRAVFLGNFFIATGQRALANVAQEFILRKITSKPKDQN